MLDGRVAVVVLRLRLMRLPRRDVSFARASGVIPMAEGAPAGRVAPATERAARREARAARTALLVGRGNRRRRWFAMARGGGRRRRCRAARRARTDAALRRRMRALRSAGRGLVRPADGGLRRHESDGLVRSAGGGHVSGRRLRNARGVRRGLVGAMSAERLRRHDHTPGRRQAGVRARAGNPRERRGPGVRQQSRRGHAEQERQEQQGRSASNDPDWAPRAAFVGRQRPVSPFPTVLPRR